ncbi:MAG: DUF308 domain-containing protein [Caulobacteraceae bacterium]|nr:DUF308 domain-containing protein [Caulobacteraceae bacterium]
MSTSFLDHPFQAQVRKEAGHLMWLGLAFLVIGIAALVFPMISTLAATLLVGWILIFSGVASLFGAFSIRGAGPFFGALLFGLLALAAGVFILARPLGGALAITLCLAILFMIQGAFEAVLAFELRPARGWFWMLISAVASVIVALVIIAGWPGVSLIALGIIIGVNFISSGLAYLLLGGALRGDASA